MIKVEVPALGESISEAVVVSVLDKKVGDYVGSGEVVCQLETDKVTVEVRASGSGVLSSIAVKDGDVVEVGQCIAELDESKAVDVAKPPASVEATLEDKQDAPTLSEDSSKKDSPAALKLMREREMNKGSIVGTGRGDRITKADVLTTKSASAAPNVVERGSDKVRRVRMSMLRKKIAERLKFSQNNAAILTTFNEVDMTAVMSLRSQYKDAFQAKYGIKLGFMSFFVKAVVEALKLHPDVNAEIDGDDILYKDYYNIGVAVGTDKGLVVPVIRDAGSMSMCEIESKILDSALKAKEGHLTIDEMSGGTFTISNGGTYGSLLSTPIINPPQSGILGMHNIVWRPIVVGDNAASRKVEPRPMMYIALSYDHRIVDGKGAVTFLVAIKQMLEDPNKLILGM